MDKAFIKNPVEAYEKLKEENKKFKDENESLKISLKMVAHTLEYTLQNEVGLYKRQIDNSVPDDWEYEEVLVLVEEYIEKLKKENEELKEKINSLLCSENCYKYKQADKYKQALKEIKEIAEANSGRFPDGTIWARPEIEQILEKISEVEDVSSGS